MPYFPRFHCTQLNLIENIEINLIKPYRGYRVRLGKSYFAEYINFRFITFPHFFKPFFSVQLILTKLSFVFAYPALVGSLALRPPR